MRCLYVHLYARSALTLITRTHTYGRMDDRTKQMQALLEANPQLNHVLSDPQVSLEASIQLCG